MPIMLLHLLDPSVLCATTGHFQLGTLAFAGVAEITLLAKFDSRVLLQIAVCFFHDHVLVAVVIDVVHYDPSLYRLF